MTCTGARQTCEIGQRRSTVGTYDQRNKPDSLAFAYESDESVGDCKL
jgi:hypothetical protein